MLAWAQLALVLFISLRFPNDSSDILNWGSLAHLAGVFILYRRYERVILRFTYIAAFLYWFIYLSGATLADLPWFNIFLVELIRFPQLGRGERDASGIHWSTNIAQHLSLLAINALVLPLVEIYSWKLILPNIFLSLFVFGHYLFHLWMQKIIARLSRWNRNAWRLRELILEYALQSFIQQLDSRLTTAVMYRFWSTCFWLYQFLDASRITKLCHQIFFARLLFRTGMIANILSSALRYIFLWVLFIRSLAKLANPDPPNHQYRPLREPDHIRILLLYPRFGFQQISGALIQGAGIRFLFYEAISYTWGSGDRSREIFVDGARMEVTRSVYEVLATYSSFLVPKLLWIDAICINQDDLDEKALQVPLMERIYMNADLTTVFLGQEPLRNQEPPKSNRLLPYRYDHLTLGHSAQRELCRNAHAVFDLFREFHVLKDQLGRRGNELYEMYEMLPGVGPKIRTWTALQQLFQHPWFQRVWVVQEVALSDTVQVRYGDDVLDWDIMAEAVTRLQQSRNFRLWLEWEHNVPLRHVQYTNMYNIVRIDKLRESLHPRGRHTRVKRPSLSDILQASFFFLATDPRDQIYGLTALCKSTITVDYGTSTEETFIDAALQLMRIGSIRTVLHAAGLGNRAEHNRNLPTWVPDWREAPKYDMIDAHSTPSYQLTQAERESDTAAPSWTMDRKILKVSSTLIDTVVELGPILFDQPLSGAEGTMDEMHRLAKSLDGTRAMIAASPLLSNIYEFDKPNQSLDEALCRTMLVDRKYPRLRASAENYLLIFNAWLESLSWLGQLSSAPSDISKEKNRIYQILVKMDDMTESLEHGCSGRRLFITRQGYIGLCPPRTVKDDIVHVVPGLRVVLLLRRPTSGLESKERYYLVGEGYCHGVTNNAQNRPESVQEIEII